MTIIYVDVLIVVNIYIGYFLLIATNRVLSVSPHKARLIMGCVASGLCSMIILLDMNIVELILVRLVCSAGICLLVYFKRNLKLFIKSIISFYIVNFLFGGVIYAVNGIVKTDVLACKNGICYVQISLLTLAIYTIVAYLLVGVFDYLFKRRCQKTELSQVTVKLGGRETILTAFADTGNKLIDVLTGLPVMVCELNALEGFLPTKLYHYLFTNGSDEADLSLCKGIRVIPLRVVSGETSLMAFKPQTVIVGNKQRDMLVAVTGQPLSDGSYNAIISA